MLDLVWCHVNIFTIARSAVCCARMWKPADALPLKASQRADLEALVRSGKTPQRVAARAAIVLATGDGKPMNAIAREFRVSRPTVYLWRRRFEEAGIVGLVKDAPRPGRRKALTADQIATIVDATLHTTPPDATHWTVRTMAKAQGISHAIVHRICARTACSRIASRRSSSVVIPTLSRNCATSSASISIRPIARWCSAWMKNPKCRRSTAPSRCCRCARIPARQTHDISGTARRTCLPRSTSWMARCSPAAPRANVTPSSCVLGADRAHRAEAARDSSDSRQLQRTRIRPSRPGLPRDRGITAISSRPVPHG